MITIPVALVILATANCVRGGLWGDQIRAALGGWACLWKTQSGRFIGWGVPFGFAAWMFGLGPLDASVAGFMAGLGACTGQAAPLSFLPLNWTVKAPLWLWRWLFDPIGALSMGHRGGTDGARAWFFMACWGVLRVAPVAALLFLANIVPGYHFAPWWLLASGLMTPVVYDAVWRVPERWYRDTEPVEVAEVIMGAVMAGGLWGAVG